jgi:hypothetical protein
MGFLRRILLSAQELNGRTFRAQPRPRRRRWGSGGGLQPVAAVETLEERVLLSATAFDIAVAMVACQPVSCDPPAAPSGN